MKLRFTLYDDTEELVINEPDGAKKADITFERHPELYSTRVRMDTPLDYYGTNSAKGVNGGRDFVIRKQKEKGPDGAIGLLTEASYDGFTWIFLSDQEVPLAGTFSESVGIDHRAQATGKETGIWTRLMNLFESMVDINSATNLDGTAATVYNPIDLKLPGQIINKTTSYEGHSGDTDTLDPVALATTVGITLSGHQVIDGVLTEEGVRVLVKDQSSPEDNGVYIASVGAWSRSADANTNTELELAIVSVQGGDTNAGNVYRVAEDTIILGTTAITFVDYNYVDHYIFAENSDTNAVGDDWLVYTPDTLDLRLSEIITSLTRPFISVADYPEINPTIESVNDRGVLTINGSIDLSYRYTATASGVNPITDHRAWVRWFWQLNDEAPVLIDDMDTGFLPVPLSYPLLFTLSAAGQTFSIKPGDRVKSFILWFSDDAGGAGANYLTRTLIGGIVGEDVTFELKSEFADSQIKADLIHDVFAKTCDRVLGINGSFYSPVLGSPLNTTRTYPEYGAHWAYALSKFLQVRGYPLEEKPFFTCMKDLWQGANPCFNLGMGTVMIDGEQKIIIEKKEYFFPDRVSIRLSKVYKMRRSYDGNHQFSSIEDGYEKWQIEEASGIDEVLSERTRNSRFQRIGKKLINKSKFIASMIWEQARRALRTLSADYKYDDDIGIVNVRLDDDGLFTPVIDEGFSDVTGLLNENTRWNKILTPTRNFLRNLSYYSVGLQDYIGSFFKFGSGKGNYGMTATMADNGEPESFGGAPLSESQDIPVSSTPLFTAELYELIEHYVTKAQLIALIADPDAAIEISQNTPQFTKFYIHNIKVTQSTGLIRGTLWAKVHMDLSTDQTQNKLFGPEFDIFFE